MVPERVGRTARSLPACGCIDECGQRRDGACGLGGDRDARRGSGCASMGTSKSLERPAVADSSTSTEMPPDQLRHSFGHPQAPGAPHPRRPQRGPPRPRARQTPQTRHRRPQPRRDRSPQRGQQEFHQPPAARRVMDNAARHRPPRTSTRHRPLGRRTPINPSRGRAPIPRQSPTAAPPADHLWLSAPTCASRRCRRLCVCHVDVGAYVCVTSMSAPSCLNLSNTLS